MADVNRASSFAKNLQKHAGRAKELFRQNLGKADRTTDEGFDEYVRNFNIQQFAASRLSKEVRNYNNCVKALQAASKSLMELVCDLYETHWIDHDKVQVQADILEKKWDEFHSTIDEQVIKPLASYSEQFTDVTAKILKRRRKLLDYDCCRHTIQNLEQHGKKKEEAKINKAKEQLDEKQSLYESINSELMDELPALWDSRIAFLASNFQCLFLAEATFHCESYKIFCDLNDVVESLALENRKGIYAIKRYPGGECAPAGSSNESYVSAQGSGNGEETLICSDNENSVLEEGKTVQYESDATANDKTEQKENLSPVKSETVEDTEDQKESSVPAVKQDLPPGVLQKVKATYQYTAEDGDELSFEPGEIINVIEFEDPEQQEEGWLMGYKEGTDIKGLFPANFTRPV